MKLTGRELFDVTRNGRRCRVALGEIRDHMEVLGLANLARRQPGKAALAAALDRWQWRMQNGLPPRAA